MSTSISFCLLYSCRQDMEQQLGSLILATDISRQNEFLSTFREHLDNRDLDLQLASHRHFMLQVETHCTVYGHLTTGPMMALLSETCPACTIPGPGN